jgi:hypothetical protein
LATRQHSLVLTNHHCITGSVFTSGCAKVLFDNQELDNLSHICCHVAITSHIRIMEPLHWGRPTLVEHTHLPLFRSKKSHKAKLYLTA